MVAEPSSEQDTVAGDPTVGARSQNSLDGERRNRDGAYVADGHVQVREDGYGQDGERTEVDGHELTVPAPEHGRLDAEQVQADGHEARADGHPQARTVVELRGLCRTYGTDPPVNALRGVDLTIRAGDWMAIVGPSGSGKSTLLNILGCLDRPTEGTYHIDGIDAAGLSDDERAALRAQNIGFVFQTFHLLGHRTAVENVMLADLYAGGDRGDRRERAQLALERVGMGHRRDFLPTKLSGGEQQRVAIARALLASPRLLLCDEPTGNLDSANSASVMALFEGLAHGGLTLVVITHDEDVAAHARRVVRIVDGQLTEMTE